MRRKSNKIPKLHIRSGDEVKVLSGQNRGLIGRVLKVFPELQKAIVEGANIRTRHIKPNTQMPNGNKIEFERPIHVSKLMLINPNNGLPSRTRKEKGEKGWERVYIRTSK